MNDPSSGDCSDCGLPLKGGNGSLCPRCSLRLALSPEALTPIEAKRPLPPGLKSRFFADYEIVDEIARGGMGVVYRARQLGLNRLVALKMVQSHHLLSDEARLRFRVEIEAVAQLHHPHIVSLYESGEQDGAHYFTMRLVEGGDLAVWLEHKHPLRQIIQLLVKVCRAVHYAHQRGILHRDLKPSNILVDEQGEPHVADFGLAKSLDQDTGFTFTSSVLGSPNYMAPEQASGKVRQLTTAVDVYGLGAILYHALAARPPFQAGTPIETLRQVVDRDPAPPHTFKPDTDSDLETIALKCLRKEPGERYGTAEEVAQDLERWLAGEPIHARPLGPIATAWRWSQRHPVATVLASSLTLALIVIVVGTAFGIVRIRSANERTESIVTRMQIQKAEDLFSDGETSQGLAILAQVVRKEPAHVPARRRLLSALQHRSYALPVFPPITPSSPFAASTILSGGRELMTLTQAGEARRWSLSSGEDVGTVFHLQRPIKIAAMTEDGQKMLIGFRDGGAQLRTGPDLKEVHELSVMPDGIVATTFSDSGKMAAAASVRLAPSFEVGVRVWDTAAARPATALLSHALLVTDIEFTRDERHLATVCADGRIRFWSVTETGTAPSLVVTQQACLTMCFDRSGRWMAVGEYEGGIKVWDLKDLSRPKWSFQHARRINDLCFSASAGLLLSASSDDTAQVWNLATGAAHGPPLRHGNLVNSARFSPDERYVVTASNDNTARLWETDSGRPLSEELPHRNALTLASFTADGRRVLTATFGGAIALWELRQPFVSTLRVNHTGYVSQIRFSPDGRKLASGSLDGEVRITDVRTGGLERKFRQDGPVQPLAYSPDGRMLACGGPGRTVQVFDATSGAPTSPPFKHNYSIEKLEFDRTGTRLLVTAEVQAQVWDTIHGRAVGPSISHPDVIKSARLSPDGQRVVTASKDRTVRLWSASSGKAIGPPLREGEMVNCLEFSPDGKRLLVAGSSHEAFLVSLATREEMGPRLRHRGSVSHAAFNLDGTRIVTASEDQTAKVWALDAPDPLMHSLPHHARVTLAEFSHDGQMILTLSSDGTARLWDANSGHLIADPIYHPAATFACLSPDGGHLAISAADGTVLFRPISDWTGTDPSWLIDLAEQVARQRFLPPDRFVPLSLETQSRHDSARGKGQGDSLKGSMERWFQSSMTSY